MIPQIRDPVMLLLSVAVVAFVGMALLVFVLERFVSALRPSDGPDRASGGGSGGAAAYFRRTFAATGLVLVGLAVVVLFRPELLPQDQLALETLTERIRTRMLHMLAGAAILGGVVLYLGRHVVGVGRTDVPSRSSEPVPYSPELIVTEPSSPAGTAFDDRLESVGAGGSHPDRLETSLRELALDLLVTYGDHDEETAAEKLANGSWTADPRAAAFLGEPEVAGPRWYVELWDWLHPTHRVKRRVRHTVRALERFADTNTPGGTE